MEDFQSALLNHNTSVTPPTGRSSQSTSETMSVQHDMIANTFHKYLEPKHYMMELLSLTTAISNHVRAVASFTGEWKKLFRSIHRESSQFWFESPPVLSMSIASVTNLQTLFGIRTEP